MRTGFQIAKCNLSFANIHQISENTKLHLKNAQTSLISYSTFTNGEVREVKGQMLLWICPFPIPFVLLAITSNDRRE